MSSVHLCELVVNFKSRNLMQSGFSLSLLWLFDLLNFEVPNLLRINEIHGSSSLALICHFSPRSKVLNGSCNLNFFLSY